MELIRRLLGLGVVAVSLLLGLFAAGGWFSSEDDFGHGLAIFFGVLSAALLIIGARWAKRSRQLQSWRDDPATDRQITFARDLGISFSDGIRKGEISDLIEKAKRR
jgi:hypothetical protein